MTCLIVMNWRQRLLQVGTCVISRPASSHRFARLSQSFQCHQSSDDLSRSIIRAGVGGHSCLSRPISTLSSRGGPLSTAMSRKGRVILAGQGDIPRLLEGGRVVEELDDTVKMESVNVGGGKPVITVPVHLEKRLEKKQRKDSTKRAIREKIVNASREGRKSDILIHCKNHEHNHYRGQSYSSKGEVPLACSGWRHRKSGSVNDFFTIYPGFKRKSNFFAEGTESITFQDLGIAEQLCENLKNIGIEQPTHIQVSGIPHIIKAKRTMVAAETGCGKTLVYLLPIINQILQDWRFRVRAKPGHPTSIILVPSRELADQIYEVALKLTYNLDMTVKCVQGGSLANKIGNPTVKPIDILVATTNALKVLSSAGVYGLSRVLHVVLDEADTLLDDSFFPELVGPFLNRLPWKDLQREIQLTLVSATMPQDLRSSIGQIMNTDDFYTCSTPGLHSILPHVPQTFLRLNKSKKPSKILDLMKEDKEKNIPSIIFCNKSATCDWLSHFLNDEGYTCAAVHGRMPLRYRKGRVDMYKQGEINVLISTDLASRGIDAVRTQHVINYEFPMHVADYIHRCGRTGRVGSQHGCRVTNFISRPGEVGTVSEIELSVRKERTLSDVDANIKRLYGKQYGSFVEIQAIRDDDEEDNAQKDRQRTNDDDDDDDFSDDDRDESKDFEKADYRLKS